MELGGANEGRERLQPKSQLVSIKMVPACAKASRSREAGSMGFAGKRTAKIGSLGESGTVASIEAFRPQCLDPVRE